MFRSFVRRLVFPRRPPRLSYPATYTPSLLDIPFQRPYSGSISSLCPSCSQPFPTPLPACPNCAYISAVSSTAAYHEMFGLAYSPNPFVVDVSLLKCRFRQAQAICHPDAWASRGPGKQDLAQTLSSRINHAYQALLAPLSRAEYILERNGFEISETDHLTDLDFISEIMEAREELDGGNAENVAIVENENNEKVASCLQQIEKLVGAKDWSSVREATVRLKYLQGIQKAVKEWRDAH